MFIATSESSVGSTLFLKKSLKSELVYSLFQFNDYTVLLLPLASLLSVNRYVLGRS